MSPPLALALTLLLIGYLLHRDSREEPRVSSAVWIPIIWLMINGSRQVSQWIGGGQGLSAQALTEGNAVDQAVYGGLIFAGVWILARRRIRVGEIVKNNLPIVLFLVYGGLSVLWSDYPFTTFKRWFKALGDPTMVLLLWSDPSPARAIMASIRRCAYFLIPLSILFCKYYENLGRTIDSWGDSYYTGVTLDKNMFGYLLFTFGLFFIAAFLSKRNHSSDKHKRVPVDQTINILFLAMIGWLLPIANSKTATLALIAGIAVVVALRFATVQKHFWSYALVAIFVGTVANQLWSAQSAVLEAVGRDATLTGRTGIWETVLQEPINPLIGAGYASFWIGERLARIWAIYPNTPLIQAHNGYIEVYLNLGLIGLCLIVAVLWRGLRMVRSRVALSLTLPMSEAYNERLLGTFGLAYGVAYLLYNATEATFTGLNFLFLIFLILAFDHRQMRAPIERLSILRNSQTERSRSTIPHRKNAEL